MKIDKINNELAFNEEHHKYWNVKHPDREYTSVTTLVGKYYPHFDEEFWSRYKSLQSFVGEEDFDGPLNAKSGKRSPPSEAKKQLLNTKVFDYDLVDLYDIPLEDFDGKVNEIKLSYKVANEVACERGNIHHNAKENRFYTKKEHVIEEYNFNLPITGVYTCEKGNFDLSKEKGVFPEFLIYFSTADKILNLAGQVDLIIKDGNDIFILDYKTNAKGMGTEAYEYFDKNIRRKVKEKMFYPINNLDNHMLNHYTLQLSLYAWMLQRINPEFNIKILRLLHIDGEDVETIYDVPYIKEDVTRMLGHYKKQIKIKHYRETGKML